MIVFAFLFYGAFLVRSAYVRDVVRTLHDNNLGPATKTQQVTIDFETCAGATNESLLVDLETESGEIVPIRIRCEGLFLHWESELIEIVPEFVEKTAVATCEADEILSLLGSLAGENYKSAQNVEEVVENLFQTATPATAGRRRLQDLEEEERTCITIPSDAKLPDLYDIPNDYRCEVTLFEKIESLWKNNITQRGECDETTLQYQMPKHIQVGAHPLCANTTEEQSVPLQYRVAWMQNQFRQAAYYEEYIAPFAVTYNKFEPNRLTETDYKTYTETVTYNAELAERMRQILTVGPYDKMRACYEAQAFYVWPFVNNSVFGCQEHNASINENNQTVVNCLKYYDWYNNSRVNENDDWKDLFLNNQHKTLEEFTKAYVNTLSNQNVYVPKLGINVDDTYPFESEGTDPNNDKFAPFLATNRHTNLRSTNFLVDEVDTLHWQFDMPCSEFTSTISDLEPLLKDGNAHTRGDECDSLRLHVDDNRCKFDPARPYTAGLPESALCVPHFVFELFPMQTWNSPECVAFDETEFFCGLASGDTDIAEKITLACTNTTDVEGLREALHTSLIQMWDDEGKRKYNLHLDETNKLEKFKKTFCNNGNLPNHNTFDFKAYTNFSIQDVVQGAECPCGFADAQEQSGMRVCPLNPWFELDGQKSNLGRHQACVRHSGLSSCMPIWSEQFARIPFEKRHQGYQNRCDSKLFKEGYDGSRFTDQTPPDMPWSGDFDKAQIVNQLYQIIQEGDFNILNYEKLEERNGKKYIGDSGYDYSIEQPLMFSPPVIVQNSPSTTGIRKSHELEDILIDKNYSKVLSENNYNISELFETFIQELSYNKFGGRFCADKVNFKYNFRDGEDKHGSCNNDDPKEFCYGNKCEAALFRAIDNECLTTISNTWKDEIEEVEPTIRNEFDYEKDLEKGGVDFELRKKYHWMEPFLRFNKKKKGDETFHQSLFRRHAFKIDQESSNLKHYWAVAKDATKDYTLSKRFDIERVGRILRLYRCPAFAEDKRFLNSGLYPNPDRSQDQKLDQSYHKCHPGENIAWEPALTKNLKDLMTCYELKIRGFTRVQWYFRSKYMLNKRLGPYLETESRKIPIIQRIEDRYSKEMYGEVVDAVLTLLKKDEHFYIPLQNPDSKKTYTYKYQKGASLQKYGGTQLITRVDEDDVRGNRDNGRRRRNYYSKNGYYWNADMECIDSFVVLEDYSSYRYNLHLVQKENIQLGKQIEVWFSKLQSEESNAMIIKAKKDQQALMNKTRNALDLLRTVSAVDETAVQQIEINIGIYMDRAQEYLEQMETLSETLEAERKSNSERLASLDDLISDLNANNTASLAFLSASIEQMEAAKDSIYELAEGVLLTTSRTKEVVAEVQNMLFRMRRGNQDYTRHARDVVEIMSFRWRDENTSTAGYHTQADTEAFLPFVPRTPALPASFINGSFPRFRDLALLPDTLEGVKGVLPVAIGRGWTLQRFNSYWHLVQHRLEFACDAKSLLDAPDFLSFTPQTWASLLGPSDCRLDKTGLPRCNACKLRLLAHACPLKAGAEEDQRLELERATIYNETFVTLYLKQDLEDLSTGDRELLLGCKHNASLETVRVSNGFLSLGQKTWSKAEPLRRLETLSAYTEPSESLLKRYSQAYEDSYDPEIETSFGTNPNAQAGEATIFDKNTLEAVPAVRLFRGEYLTGVSIADRGMWGQTSYELCYSPRQWGFADRLSSNVRGSSRMVWLFSPGYDRSEMVLGSSMTMDGLLETNDWWRQWYNNILNDNERPLSSEEEEALSSLNASFTLWDSLLCSQDFSAAKGYSEVWKSLQTILSMLPNAPSREEYMFAGIPYFQQYPSWLGGNFGLKPFVGQQILQMIQLLPYSRLFHELVAARTGRMPPEGIATEFFPRLHFPNVPDPVVASSHQEDSKVNENPRGEQEEIVQNAVEQRNIDIASTYNTRQHYEHVRTSSDEYESTEPDILPTTNAGEEEPEAEFVEYEYSGGTRCYQSTWLSTGRHGLPLYKWKLLPHKTRVQVHIEPVNSSLPSSEQWRNFQSGVKISSVRIPENLLAPWRELYWLGNSSCSFENSACTWPGKTTSIPFVYDIGKESIQSSLAPGAKHSPVNAIRFIVNQSNSYGPLKEKALYGHSPAHLFRVPFFEEIREQRHPFPLDTTDLGTNSFDATRAYSSAQEFFRPLIRSGPGRFQCMHLGDDVVANTNCLFLENMQHISTTTSVPLSAFGQKQEHTFRSAGLSAQQAPLGVSLEIPENTQVRARLAFSACPYDLRVLRLFSQKVAVQAFFPSAGEFTVVVSAPQTQECSGNFSWAVLTDNQYEVFSLPKGSCHLTKLNISLKEELCVTWNLVEEINVTALLETPPPTVTQLDFAYSVYANTQNRQIISLLADLVESEQAYSFLLQEHMLNYEDYQLRKTAVGWVVEKANTPTSGLVLTNKSDSYSYVQENLQKGAETTRNATDTAQDLGTDPPDILYTESECDLTVQNDLQNSGVTDSESSIAKFNEEMEILLSEILNNLSFWDPNISAQMLNWTENFTANVYKVEQILDSKVPSLFKEGQQPSETQWECLRKMAALNDEELSNIYASVQAAIDNSNPAVVTKYGPPSALYMGTLVGSFLTTLLLVATPMTYVRLKKKSAFMRAVCCCIKSNTNTLNKKVVYSLLAVVLSFLTLFIVGLLCLLVFF